MAVDAYMARVHPPAPAGPLIFAFHGTGGDESQFFNIARQLAPEAGVIAPRGDVSEHGAARFFRRTAEGVYDMEDLRRRTDKMAAFIEAHKTAHPGAAIYGFGYSNGANILASVMMARPDLFDRVGLLHPLIPWEPDPIGGLAGRRVLVTAGRQDPICPWPLSERLMDWLRAQGADLTAVVHDGGHEMRADEGQALAELLA